MPIVFSCACGKSYSVAEALAGKTARCKGCGVMLTVPQPTPPEPEPEFEAVVAEEDSGDAVPTTPTRTTPSEPVDDTEPAEPRWFQGFLPSGGKMRVCRICHIGEEVLFLDAGPHVVEGPGTATKVGAMQGGLVGALLGMAVDATVKRLSKNPKIEAEKRQDELDAMTPEELRAEAEAGGLSRRFAIADVTQAHLRPRRWTEAANIRAVLQLETTKKHKKENLKIFLSDQDEIKAGAKVLKRALGKNQVTVEVPLKRKDVQAAEARETRQRRITQAVGAVLVLLLLGIGLYMALRQENPAGPPVNEAIAAPEGFFVLDQAPADAGEPVVDTGTLKQRRQVVEFQEKERELAKQAPPFDPTKAPTLDSPLLARATRQGTEYWMGLAEKRLKGEALPKDVDVKTLDRFLRGQTIPTPGSRSSAAPPVWDPIPGDAPATPLRFGLPTGIALEPVIGANNVLLASGRGPYFVSLPSWLSYWPSGTPLSDIDRDPKNRKLYIVKKDNPRPGHAIIDLRTGQSVGEFHAKAPVWANARLSPGGTYLAGPDTHISLEIMKGSVSGWENSKDQFYLWKKGQATPTTLKVPGPVDWLEFLSDDQLAYTTHTPEPVLRIHDVAKNQPIGEVALPGATPEPFPDRSIDETPVYPGMEFYRPQSQRGAVSAQGRYVALGCQDGVRLISVEQRRVVGLLPLAKGARFRGLNFSPDGTRLFAIVAPGPGAGFHAWSVATGAKVDEGPIDPYSQGPVVAGPREGLYVSRLFFFTRSPVPLDEAPYRIVRIDDAGTALVVAALEKAPADTPPCVSMREQLKAGQATPEAAKAQRTTTFALFQVPMDWSKAVSKVDPVLALITPRPAVAPGDRSKVTAQKPQVPASWSPPSFSSPPSPPAEGDDPAATHQFGAWPTSVSGPKAAVVRYQPRHQYWLRHEVILDLIDPSSGRRLAPAVKLWDWATYPDEPGSMEEKADRQVNGGIQPLPALAALAHDQERLALVDPNDPRRVDLFKVTGERQLGFLPDAKQRVDWLDWSGTHLLTVSGGRLTAWDPNTTQAIFEVDGGYTHVGLVSPDRKWVILWTGTHADILDTATGVCLGRCQAGGFSGKLKAYTLSPDGRRLAAAFTGWPQTLKGAGVGYTAAVWDLEKGKAGLYGFPGEEAKNPTCAWVGTEHLLLSGRPLTEPATLIDARLNLVLGTTTLADGAYATPLPAMGSPDGRVWFATRNVANPPPGLNLHAPNHPDFPNGYVWQTLALPGMHGEDDDFRDPERVFMDVQAVPVQVQVKIGSKAQNETCALTLARRLIAMGFRIGPGGTVLRLEGTVADSQESVTFSFGAEVKVPRCTLNASWLSQEGKEIWKAGNAFSWSMRGSKYKVSEKQEFVGPGGGVSRLEFDFQGRNPSTAMRAELLDNMAGGGGLVWLEPPALRFIQARGKERPIPIRAPMAHRLAPAAK